MTSYMQPGGNTGNVTDDFISNANSSLARRLAQEGDQMNTRISTQAIPENGGGGISTVRDRLGSNQQRRFDKRNDRHQRRSARADRRHARDMQQAEANGASRLQMLSKELNHSAEGMQRDYAFHQKMQGLYGQNSRGGGGARPNPQPDGPRAGVHGDHFPGYGGGGGRDVARPNPQLGRPNPGANGDRFPGMGGGGGGTATTMAIPEGGGGRPTPTQGSGGSGGSRPNFPGMPGFAPPKADGAKPYTGGGKPAQPPQPRPNPTSEIAPAPKPSPNPEKEKRREARTQRRADRQERRDNRADKRAKRAEAQKFKNKKQKRITGKDEMPYS